MQPLGLDPLSFTVTYNGQSDVLSTEVIIIEAFDPASLPEQPPQKFKAIWDTGATNSVITSNVIATCGLKPTGIVDVHTAQGSHRTETYLVGILLPNRVAFPNVKVSRGVIRDFDVLIGMDIIGSGDFAVTNKDGQTVFSFRMPSLERIDFVNSSKKVMPVSTSKVGRNSPCPCGSGKKYKKCHGR